MEPSTVEFSEHELGKLSKFVFTIYRVLGLIRVVESEVNIDADDKLMKKKSSKDDRVNQIANKGKRYVSSNFTLINFYLNLVGPKRENELTTHLLIVQVVCCFFAFVIRYQLSKLFYD
jgi:hypothetical protein